MSKEQPASEEAMLRVLSPRDWDGFILRFVEPTPGGPLAVEAWDPEGKRWWRSDANHNKVSRAPLATHREMDLQGVPADDRTRLNPKG